MALMVGDPEAKQFYAVMRACVLFDVVFVHCEQDSIHFHHIKGLRFSLLEILIHSREVEFGGKLSDVAKRFSVLGAH